MCAHYDPPTSSRLSSFFGVGDLPLDLKPSLWPGYHGPFLRKHEFADAGDEAAVQLFSAQRVAVEAERRAATNLAGGPSAPSAYGSETWAPTDSVAAVPFRELLTGSFGLIPHWSKDATIARRTYNARSETVQEKPSYRDAWKLSRHCIIPAEAIFEPDWRSGKAVATRITRADGMPMGIAGLWSAWKGPTGDVTHSYTMLTINADDHPFMRQYHKPEDEKRMVVILDETDYDAWLSVPVADSSAFLRQFPADNLIGQQPQQFLL